MAKLVAGFDPGGTGKFGWCIAEMGSLPLQIRSTGVASFARDAAEAIQANIAQDDTLVGAGIDAPLFWSASGDRAVDQIVRHAVGAAGGQTSTVMHVNSMQGSCLIQGVVVGLCLREAAEGVPLTESHPKAMLWLTETASPGNPPAQIDITALGQFFILPDNKNRSDHERDAALGALSAWAMIRQPKGWQDLYPREREPFSALGPPLAYWMPM